MNANHHKIGFALMLCLFASTLNAADIAAGKSRAETCQGCHGNAGVSNNSLWPNLAGQPAIYLEAQLKKFKSGTRDNPTMKPIAEALSDADIQNLAAYFASLPAKSSGGDATLAKAGKDQVPQCMGCHGNKLQGQGQFPRLAGQHPQYLAKQLSDFKSGSRNSSTMNAIAKTLTEDNIKAIATYLGSLTN
ncbi:MAG: cytochrome c4 [Methylococcaceae bacterium]|nr:cytochrome c4 [Methylococcaceae bacterium]